MGEWSARMGEMDGLWRVSYTTSEGVCRDVCQLVWCRRMLHEHLAVERIVSALNLPPGGCSPAAGPWVLVRRTAVPDPAVDGRVPGFVEFGVHDGDPRVEALIVWWSPPPVNVDGWTGRIVAALNWFAGQAPVELDQAAPAPPRLLGRDGQPEGAAA